MVISLSLFLAFTHLFYEVEFNTILTESCDMVSTSIDSIVHVSDPCY